MLKEALERHKAGDHEAAERLYRDLLAQNDDNAEAHHLLAVLKREQGALDEALTHAEKALQFAPDKASYHLTLGGILHGRGDLAGARANIERAVELDPNIPEGHNTLGFLQYVQGDLEAAEASLRLALKVQADAPGVLNNLGLVHLAAGRTERARSRFEQALSLRPDDLAAQTGLGRAFLAEGAASFAEQCFRKVLEARPGNLAVTGLLADALLANERAGEAERYFQQVVNADPSNFGAQVGLADSALAQGRAGQAAQRYSRALTLQRGHVPTVVKLGHALLQSGQFEGARRCFERLIEQGIDGSEIRTGLGRAQAGLGDSTAQETLRAVLAADRANRSAALALATLLGEDDDHEAAAAVLSALPEADRRAGEVCVALARHQVLAGHPRDALAAVTDFPAGADHALAALELEGRAWDELGDHAAAVDCFTRLAAEAATPPPELSFADVSPETIRSWPRTPPDDDRGEPLFLAGLAGSGVEALAAALASLTRVDVLADRTRADTPRNDFLARADRPGADLAELDEHGLLMGRRRYWHGVRHVRSKLAEGIAGVDWLPPGQTDLAAIARFFPGATILLATRDPADHLLHTESFGWRHDAAPTVFDLEEFYGHIAAVAGASALRIVPLDFDRLRAADGEDLVAVFAELGIPLDGFDTAFQSALYDAGGLHRYWRPGHAAHYSEALGFTDESLTSVRAALAAIQSSTHDHAED